MRWRHPRSGHTLFEVLWTAGLLAVLAGVAVPAFRSTVDRVQAVAAREAVVAFAARARAEARAHGGAVLEIAEEEGRLRLLREEEVVERLHLSSDYGVTVDAGADGGSVLLRFDPRGVGSVANRTVAVRRGGAERAAVFSTFGRVARR